MGLSAQRYPTRFQNKKSLRMISMTNSDWNGNSNVQGKREEEEAYSKELE